MLRIVMDSAGDMPHDWAEDYDIQVIPINIQFKEQTFLQGVDLSNDDFYRIVNESGVIPTTSQPTPQQFVEFYRRIAEPGDTILSIHVTGKLSGTLDSAKIAARELATLYNIIPIDSASGTIAQGYMCREARIMDRAGATIEKIVERLRYISRNVQIIFTINTMEYARRSGRVRALQAALVSVLNIKPIVELGDGVLEMSDRARTRGKALETVLEKMVQRVKNRLVNAAVIHAADQETGKKFLEAVRTRLNCNELVLSELSVSLAAHFGPGTIAIMAYPLEER